MSSCSGPNGDTERPSDNRREGLALYVRSAYIGIMNSEQIKVLLDAAIRAGDAGVADHARRALDAKLAESEPWAVKAAAQRCTGFVADARRHGGVTVNEWTLPEELLGGAA